MKRLIRLFPSRWRERYGDEFEAVLAATPASASSILDVLRYAARSHGRTIRGRLGEGGLSVGAGGGPSRRSGVLAVVGSLLILPSALFVVASVLEYQLGFVGVADVFHGLAAWELSPLLLLGLPAFGLVLAAIPLVVIRLTSEGDSAAGAHVVLHLRVGNLAVAAFALAALGALLLYAVLENL